MERESGEGGLMTRALLVEEKADTDGIGGSGGDSASGSSPVTATLLLGTFVATSGLFSYGCAGGYSSPAEAGIKKDLGLSTAEYSVFASIMTIGGMLGAVISGKIADLIGRRGAMWFSDIFCIIGWLPILFAKGVWWLDLGRFSMGFGYGILTYVGCVYVAEITPKNIRGGFTSANQLMLCGGISLMFFIGNIFNWRILAIFGNFSVAFPLLNTVCKQHHLSGLHFVMSPGLFSCLVQFLGLFFIPESPRWLAKNGLEKELEATLQRLRGKNVDTHAEAAEIRDYTKTFQHLSKSRILDLFEQRYAHSLTIGVGIMLLLQFGGTNAILYYASSIFEAAGCSTHVGTTAMAVIQIPFTVLSVFLVDKSGRRPLLMVAAAGTCLGNFLVGLAFLLQDLHQPKELSAILALSGILVYCAFFSIGMNSTAWVLISEIFPINIRGSAGSLVNFSNSFSAWIVSYAFNFLFEWSSTGIFFFFATICGSTVLFVAMLVPETKGRSLEEIQASMIHLLQ